MSVADESRLRLVRGAVRSNDLGLHVLHTPAHPPQRARQFTKRSRAHSPSRRGACSVTRTTASTSINVPENPAARQKSNESGFRHPCPFVDVTQASREGSFMRPLSISAWLGLG
jgi:hypothetical protein